MASRYPRSSGRGDRTHRRRPAVRRGDDQGRARVGNPARRRRPVPPRPPPSSLAIPTTLHDSLMARLDRLHPVKEVAQIAAVIGRAFDHATIAALSALPTPELSEAMGQAGRGGAGLPPRDAAGRDLSVLACIVRDACEICSRPSVRCCMPAWPISWKNVATRRPRLWPSTPRRPGRPRGPSTCGRGRDARTGRLAW